jgi:hypothetical protein
MGGALPVDAHSYIVKKNERWMKGKDLTGAGTLPLYLNERYERNKKQGW